MKGGLYLEAIIDNPIILFILIGLISSLFQKMKGTVQDGNQRPVRRPMDKGRPVESTERDEYKPLQMEEESSSLNDLQKVYLERKKQAEERPANQASERSKMNQRSRLGVSKSVEADVQKPSLDLRPDRDKLVEGIIWSEVLGQPRSKKPYHRARRN